MRGEAGGGGWSLARPARRAGPEDHRMAAEQQRRILDEHGVRMVGQIGEADQLEFRIG